jgi:hypothetical protein
VGTPVKSILRRVSFSALLLLTFGAGTQSQDETISNSDINVTAFEELQYPHIAATGHVQGIVVVRISLDGAGKVVAARALSGPKLLLRETVDNAKQWTFEPNPQKTEIIVYHYRIEGACQTNYEPSQFIFYPPNFATITTCGRVAVP